MISENIQKQILQSLFEKDSKNDKQNQDIYTNEDINKYILEVLSCKIDNCKDEYFDTNLTNTIHENNNSNTQREPKFMDSLLDKEFIKDLHICKVKNTMQRYNQYFVSNTERIDFFTACKNAPQHINHMSMFTKKDINVFVGLYLQMYGMNFKIDSEIIDFIESKLHEYIIENYNNKQK